MDTVQQIISKVPPIFGGTFTILGKRLRKQARRGAIVVVGVVNVVGVELHLVVVEVEDRRLHELAVRIRTIAFARSHHRGSRFSTQKESGISSHP